MADPAVSYVFEPDVIEVAGPNTGETYTGDGSDGYYVLQPQAYAAQELAKKAARYIGGGLLAWYALKLLGVRGKKRRA